MKLYYPFGQPPEDCDVLWRCEAKRYSYIVDPDRDEYGITDPRLELCWYPVARRTPKGALLIDGGRLVILTRNKAWARNTIDEAIKDFTERRKRQIKILQGQLQRAERDLALTYTNPRHPIACLRP